MANSLQDQLLKAGLVNNQTAKQTRAAKRKKNRQSRGKGEAGDDDLLRVQQAAVEKVKRDRELNRKHHEEARRKAEANELRQLIHAHRIARRDGDVPYSFPDGGSLKRIYVTVEQQGRLASGRLAVVRQDTGYELVSAQIAEKIRRRDESLVLVLNGPGDKSSEDDEYADYKVPDDLMW